MMTAFFQRFAQRRQVQFAAALRGRRILITGASSGIGRAFALLVADAGGEAILVARRRSQLAETAAECCARGGSAHFYVADLADAAAVTNLATTILQEHGRIDVLVNNAGGSLRRPLIDTRPEDFQKLVDLNYLGPVRLTLGLLPAMLAAGAGHVVQISTIGVQTGAPNFSAYVASKAAADHFARTLRLELYSKGIRVTTIHVPLVRTAMIAPTKIYQAFPAQGLDRAARRIVRAVIRRPVRISSYWSVALEMLQVCFPTVLQWVFGAFHDPFHRLMRWRLKRQIHARRGPP